MCREVEETLIYAQTSLGHLKDYFQGGNSEFFQVMANTDQIWFYQIETKRKYFINVNI